MVCIFSRRITDKLAGLVKQIDDVVARNSDRKMAAFLVLLSNDPDSAESALTALAKKHAIRRVPLTVFDGSAGPPKYAISRDAEVTVMMWAGEKKLVRVNHAFGNGKLDQPAIGKIVADTSRFLK